METRGIISVTGCLLVLLTQTGDILDGCGLRFDLATASGRSRSHIQGGLTEPIYFILKLRRLHFPYAIQQDGIFAFLERCRRLFRVCRQQRVRANRQRLLDGFLVPCGGFLPAC